jgi:predicted nucleotidyltransferase
VGAEQYQADQVLAATLPALLQRIRVTLGEVAGIWLFGSFARGQATTASDLDLAVLAPAPLDPVAVFDLGLALGVLARRDVDLVDLRRAPVVLKKEILTGGRLVAADDPRACERFAAEAMALYVAFRDELALAAAAEGRGR